MVTFMFTFKNLDFFENCIYRYLSVFKSHNLHLKHFSIKASVFEKFHPLFKME